jgi:mevalonate kinase
VNHDVRRGWSGGKLILAGEHAVVYGHPAVAFAVDLGTGVTLTPVDGPTVVSGFETDADLLTAVTTVVGPTGWRVGLDSTLPIGRGMGSSAALAVALARALHDDLDDDGLFEAAMPVERLYHATPSGLDVAVSVRGGFIRYTKGPPKTLTSLPAPDWQVLVIDTGKAGNTGELVSGVGARRPGIDPQLNRIGALVDEAIAVLDDREALGELLLENHRLLREIGVSTPELDEIVAIAMQHGAHGAKLSGAGGGGVALALVDEPEPLVRALNAKGLQCWPTRPQTSQDSP